MWKLLSKTGAVVAALALPLAAAIPASAEIAPGEPLPDGPLPVPAPDTGGMGGLPLNLSMLTTLPLQVVSQLAGITGGAGLGGVGLPVGGEQVEGGIANLDELTAVAKETGVRDLSELADATGDPQVAQVAELGAPLGVLGLADLLALASVVGVSDLAGLTDVLGLLGGAGLPALPGLPSLPLPV